MDDLRPFDDCESGEDFHRYAEDGDRVALERAIYGVAPVVRIAASFLAGKELDPEDLVQETMMRAIRHAGRYDPSWPLRKWMCGILRHVAREARSARRNVELADDPQGADEVAMDAAVRESFELVRQALRGVPAGYREVLHRRILDGERAVDIAADMDLPIATVRSKLQRGLRILREALPHGLGVAVFASYANANAAPLPWPRKSAVARRLAGTVLVGALGLFAFVGWNGFGQFDAPATKPESPNLESIASAPSPPPETVTNREQADLPAATPAVAKVAVRGQFELVQPYDWSQAVVRAVSVPAATNPVVRSVLVFDEAMIEHSRRLRTQARAEPGCEARVDSDGSFVLLLAPGTYACDLIDPCCALVSVQLMDVTTDTPKVEGVPTKQLGGLAAHLGRRVRGRVPAGAGIVRVDLRSPLSATMPRGDSSLLRASCGYVRSAHIEPDGSFQFDGVWRAGDLLVSAEDPDGRLWAAMVGPAAGGQLHQELPPLRLATGSMTVSLPADLGVATLGLQHESGCQQTVAALSGEVHCTGLLPGKYTIAATLAEHGVLYAQGTANGAAVRMALDGGSVVRGRVVDQRDQPISGAAVVAVAPSRRRMFSPQLRSAATSDDDGWFSLIAEADNMVHVDVGDGRKRVARVPKRHDLEDFVVKLPALRIVRGQVDLGGSSPRTNRLLLVKEPSASAGLIQRMPRPSHSRVDAEGHFVMPAVTSTAATYHWWLGFEFSGTFPLVGGLEEVNIGKLAGRLARDVKGRVVDSNGAPVGDCWVALRAREHERSRSQLCAMRKLGPDGRFAFKVPSQGQWELVAWVDDRSLGAELAIDAKTSGEQQVQLVTRGAVRGGLHEGILASRSISAASVTISNYRVSYEVPVAGDGTFACRGLRPGRYKVALTSPEQRRPAYKKVEVVAGEVSSVTLGSLDGLVPVELTYAGSYVPPATAQVHVRLVHAMQPPLVWSVTNALQALQPGQWSLELVLEGERIGAAVELDVAEDAEGARVRFDVVDRDHRGQVHGARAPARCRASLIAGDGRAMPVQIQHDGRFRILGCRLDGSRLFVHDPEGERARFALAAGDQRDVRLQAAGRIDLPAEIQVGERVLLERCDGNEVGQWLRVAGRDGRRWLDVPAGAVELQWRDRRCEIHVLSGEDVGWVDVAVQSERRR